MKKVYFIGIGGIGVSALARKYLGEGWKVAGSDRSASLITTELRTLGAKIFLKQKAANITNDLDLVIYTIAIPDNHPELIRAKKLGIKILSYPESLGELSKQVFTIAIAGTHGKTTTTAMVGEMLRAARRDPMVIVGSLLQGRGQHRSNFIAGHGPLVVEACEYRRSFLNLTPQILVITNIDNDHLDYYRDLADIQSAFVTLAAKVPLTGTLICDIRDPRLAPVIAACLAGVESRRAVRCRVIDYREFDRAANRLPLKVLGIHNRLNAAAALAVAKVLRIPAATAHPALSRFRGTWRRLEYLGRTERGTPIYDDYAHHPTEIRATIAAVRRDLKFRRLIVIFQPHLYSRTKLLFREFVASFGEADEVFILPIYAARERRDPEVSSRSLAAAIPKATYVPNLAALKKHLVTVYRHDLILNLGAGDSFVLVEQLRYTRG
ncbi:MAG: UDP-N-acetylmuramate--L-alanine ligase [Patescibacteria group bacterium]